MALPSAAPATPARTIRNSVTGSGTPLKPLGDEKADDLALHARGGYDCCRFGPCHGIRRNTQALRSLNAKPFRERRLRGRPLRKLVIRAVRPGGMAFSTARHCKVTQLNLLGDLYPPLLAL